MDLKKLLRPESVAVIGASDSEGFGGGVCRNILNFVADRRRVYFVNPRRVQVLGVTCYKSMADIDDTIDLAIICTPQKTVIPLLHEAAEKGCGGAVVFASGYSEVGTKEGIAAELALKQAAESLGIAIMGPNCAGFANYVGDVQAFAFVSANRDRRGSVGVVSQSGQLCLTMMDDPSMRFSFSISAGNAKLVTLEDYMEFLVDDPDTKVVCVYLEGVKNPEKFAAVLKQAAQKKKPVVMLKAGRSEKAGEIAASHTGSLSGSDQAFDAVLKKFGAIRVDDLEELKAMSQMLATLPRLPKKAAFASMNLSGGETTICADVASLYGIEYPDFTEETLEALKEQLPDYATPNNPLDTTATLSYDADLYAKVLRTVMADPNVEMILIGYTLLHEIADPSIHFMYEGIEKVSKDKDCKPIAMIPFMENTRNPEYSNKLFHIGVPILPPTTYAFKLLAYLSAYIQYQGDEKSLSLKCSSYTTKETDVYALSEYDSKKELMAYGIGTGAELVAKSEEEAVAFATKVDVPVVMKIESADILHKSDVGGVKLSIYGEEAVRNTYHEILANVREKCPDANINGILMAPMLEKGIEMIIGVNNDPLFGPIVMVGMGGVFVEVFQDVALYPAPLNMSEAKEMLQSLKSYPLLDGYRGGKPCDIEALCKTIVQVAAYACANVDTLQELDINPVFVYDEGRGVGIADALLVKR
ncbi:MAG: acetate--CoA ligase family protein [Lachnospiraceae bacterium]|nr:acetate--CoA ligase family protein [Lachnospiraceae bacterium]